MSNGNGENKTTSTNSTTPASTAVTLTPLSIPQVADTDVVYATGPATCERYHGCEQPEQTVFIHCPHCWGTFCQWHATGHILYCKVHGPKKAGA